MTGIEIYCSLHQTKTVFGMKLISLIASLFSLFGHLHCHVLMVCTYIVNVLIINDD